MKTQKKPKPKYDLLEKILDLLNLMFGKGTPITKETKDE